MSSFNVFNVPHEKPQKKEKPIRTVSANSLLCGDVANDSESNSNTSVSISTQNLFYNGTKERNATNASNSNDEGSNYSSIISCEDVSILANFDCNHHLGDHDNDYHSDIESTGAKSVVDATKGLAPTRVRNSSLLPPRELSQRERFSLQPLNMQSDSSSNRPPARSFLSPSKVNKASFATNLGSLKSLSSKTESERKTIKNTTGSTNNDAASRSLSFMSTNSSTDDNSNEPSLSFTHSNTILTSKSAENAPAAPPNPLNGTVHKKTVPTGPSSGSIGAEKNGSTGNSSGNSSTKADCNNRGSMDRRSCSSNNSNYTNTVSGSSSVASTDCTLSSGQKRARSVHQPVNMQSDSSSNRPPASTLIVSTSIGATNSTSQSNNNAADATSSISRNKSVESTSGRGTNNKSTDGVNNLISANDPWGVVYDRAGALSNSTSKSSRRRSEVDDDRARLQGLMKRPLSESVLFQIHIMLVKDDTLTNEVVVPSTLPARLVALLKDCKTDKLKVRAMVLLNEIISECADDKDSERLVPLDLVPQCAAAIEEQLSKSVPHRSTVQNYLYFLGNVVSIFPSQWEEVVGRHKLLEKIVKVLPMVSDLDFLFVCLFAANTCCTTTRDNLLTIINTDVFSTLFAGVLQLFRIKHPSSILLQRDDSVWYSSCILETLLTLLPEQTYIVQAVRDSSLLTDLEKMLKSPIRMHNEAVRHATSLVARIKALTKTTVPANSTAKHSSSSILEGRQNTFSFSNRNSNMSSADKRTSANQSSLYSLSSAQKHNSSTSSIVSGNSSGSSLVSATESSVQSTPPILSTQKRKREVHLPVNMRAAGVSNRPFAAELVRTPPHTDSSTVSNSHSTNGKTTPGSKVTGAMGKTDVQCVNTQSPKSRSPTAATTRTNNTTTVNMVGAEQEEEVSSPLTKRVRLSYQPVNMRSDSSSNRAPARDLLSLKGVTPGTPSRAQQPDTVVRDGSDRNYSTSSNSSRRSVVEEAVVEATNNAPKRVRTSFQPVNMAAYNISNVSAGSSGSGSSSSSSSSSLSPSRSSHSIPSSSTITLTTHVNSSRSSNASHSHVPAVSRSTDSTAGSKFLDLLTRDRFSEPQLHSMQVMVRNDASLIKPLLQAKLLDKLVAIISDQATNRMVVVRAIVLVNEVVSELSESAAVRHMPLALLPLCCAFADEEIRRKDEKSFLRPMLQNALYFLGNLVAIMPGHWRKVVIDDRLLEKVIKTLPVVRDPDFLCTCLFVTNTCLTTDKRNLTQMVTEQRIATILTAMLTLFSYNAPKQRIERDKAVWFGCCMMDTLLELLPHKPFIKQQLLNANLGAKLQQLLNTKTVKHSKAILHAKSVIERLSE